MSAPMTRAERLAYQRGYAAGRRRAEAEEAFTAAFPEEDHGPNGTCDKCGSRWTDEHERLMIRYGWNGHEAHLQELSS